MSGIEFLKNAFVQKLPTKKLFKVCIDSGASVDTISELCVAHSRLEIMYIFCNDLENINAKSKMYTLLTTKSCDQMFQQVLYTFDNLKEWLYTNEPVDSGDIYPRSHSFPSHHSYMILPLIDTSQIDPVMLNTVLDVLDTLYEVGVFHAQNLGVNIKSLSSEHVDKISLVYSSYMESDTVDLSTTYNMFPKIWTPEDIVYFLFKFEIPLCALCYCNSDSQVPEEIRKVFKQLLRKILTCEYPETDKLSRIDTSVHMLQISTPDEHVVIPETRSVSKRFAKILSGSMINQLVELEIL
jgi:hypothetical protein